jgi:hypothetical protein
VAETVVAGGEIMRIVVRDAEAIVSAQHEMIGAATRSNVAIYSIDPRGLATGAEDAILIGALPAGADVPLVEMAADLRRSQDTLRTVSDLTGGRAFVNTNDVTLGFTRLVEDNSLYYVLGYQSTNTKRDGRFHAVTVKVTRPGLEVRARKGYYAPVERDGRASLPVDPVAGLLASAAPVGGLGMRVGASVLKGPDLRSLVLLTAELSHTDLSFTSEDGLFVNDVDVAYQVLDADGGRRAFDRRTIRLRLRPASRDSAAARGLRYVTEFALPPGRYQLRLVARERAGGRAGSVFYDLTVPDYATAPLALSDLLITTSMVRRTLTAGATPAVSSIFASPTTVSREWSASESLGIFAALYAAETDPPHTIDLRVAVHADHGTRVFLREDRLDSRQLGRDGRGFDYRVTIPLQAFAPGRYVLTVEARSRRGGEAVIKETEFRVMK